MSKKNPVAKYHLSDIDITHIHMVGSPAVPDATFVIMKNMGNAQPPAGHESFDKEFIFKAVDAEKMQVFGYCMVPDKADLQGDDCSATWIEIACHSLMKNLLTGKVDGEGSGVEHAIFKGGLIIESAIDPDGSLAKAHKSVGVPGGWWLGVQVTDTGVWEDIKKGKITGFSIGGTGKRTPVSKADAGQQPSGLAGFAKRFLSSIEKADGDAETYAEVTAEQDLISELWDKFYNLQDSLMSIMRDDTVTDKATPISQSVEQFRTDFIATVQAAQTAKATTDNNGMQKSSKREGDTTMTNEQLEKMNGMLTEVCKSVTTLVEKLDGKPPAEAGPKDPPAGQEAEDAKLLKTVGDLVTTVGNLTDRIEKMEKKPAARRGSSDTETIEKKDGEEAERSELAKSADGTAWDFSDAKK